MTDYKIENLNIQIPNNNFLRINSTSKKSIIGDGLSSSNEINHGAWDNLIVDLSGMNNFDGEKNFDIFWIYSTVPGYFYYDQKLSESCSFWKKTITMHKNEVKSIELDSRLASNSFDAVNSIKNKENLPFGLFKTNVDKFEGLHMYLRIVEHSTFSPENQQAVTEMDALKFTIKSVGGDTPWHSVNNVSVGEVYGDFPPTNLQISKSTISGNSNVKITWEVDTTVPVGGRAYYISLQLFNGKMFVQHIAKSIVVADLSYNWEVPNNLDDTFKVKIEGGYVFGHVGMTGGLNNSGETESIQGTLIDNAGKIYTRDFTDGTTQTHLKESPEFKIVSVPVIIHSQNLIKSSIKYPDIEPLSFRIENKLVYISKKNLLKGYIS